MIPASLLDRRRARARTSAFVLLPALLAAGCASDSNKALERSDLDGNDVRIVQALPAARVRIAASGPLPHGGSLLALAQDGQAAFAELYAVGGDSEEAWAPYVVGELETSGLLRGEFDQAIDAAERIDLHGDDVNGPADLHTDVQLGYFTGMVRAGAAFRDFLVLEGGGGINVQGLTVEVETADGAQGSDEEVWRFGLSLGGGVLVKPLVDWVGLYGRAAVHFGLDLQHSSVISTAEAGLHLTIVPGASLFGGIRWTQFVLERDSSDTHRDSDIQLDTYGPMFGLALQF